MKPIPDDTTQVVRQGVERACRDFGERIEFLGFTRTKKLFWIRRHAHTVDFLHLHRSGSSYGTPLNYSVDFRIHFAIRALNDTFPAPALNGPCSDPARLRIGQYHLRFNAQTGNMYNRCIDDLARFVFEHGEPWFHRFREAEALLTLDDSPFRQPEKELLLAAIHGNPDSDAVARSLKLLGINKP